MIRVLVADDHPVVRSGLKAILARQCGIATLGEAGTGAEVRRLVAQKPWDVVVLDVSMPGLDGVAVTERLRRNESTKHIPVILLTASANPADVSKGLAAGAEDYHGFNLHASLLAVVLFE